MIVLVRMLVKMKSFRFPWGALAKRVFLRNPIRALARLYLNPNLKITCFLVSVGKGSGAAFISHVSEVERLNHLDPEVISVGKEIKRQIVVIMSFRGQGILLTSNC